jgi:hypothetical protein
MPHQPALAIINLPSNKTQTDRAHYDAFLRRGEPECDRVSACHEYRSESTISFDAPAAPLPEAPRKQVREVDLPAGLLVPVELDTAIDSKTASVGDTLHARVVEEVRY